MAQTNEKPSILESITKVPCFRRSLLSGISGGLGAGFVCFFMTSNVRKSMKVGFGSYMAVTTGVWLYCRYNFAQERAKQKQIKKAIQYQLITEGTSTTGPPQDV